jgi:thiamine-monophosphate kinase
MKLSGIGEFVLIERIKRRVEKNYSPSQVRRIIAGIGDDSAVVETDGGKYLLATTDTMVESVHFNTESMDFQEIGYKAIVSSISDIIAMGGKPEYALVSLAVCKDNLTKDMDRLYEGMLRCGREFGVVIVGGDVVSSPRNVVITISLLGEVAKDRVIYRSGAKVGDRILVTGSFGDSGAGLEILNGRWKIQTKTDFAKKCKEKLIKKHLLPRPRVKEAEIISGKRLATAMIDSSDGLDLSIKFICQASKVGAKIWLGKIPISPSLRYLSSQREVASCSELEGNIKALNFALYGGEDYELVFTVSRGKVEKVLRDVPHTTMIGEIVPAKWRVRYLDKEGREVKLKGRGYEHFKTSKIF